MSSETTAPDIYSFANRYGLQVNDLVLIPYDETNTDRTNGLDRYCGQEAIVTEHSHDRSGVGLVHPDGNRTAWWNVAGLVFLDADREDMIQQWTAKREELDAIYKDLDWIFAIPRPTDWKPPTVSVERLWAEISPTDIWGSRGEGFVAYQNMVLTMQIAGPFLRTGDRDGFLQHVKQLKHRARLCAESKE